LKLVAYTLATAFGFLGIALYVDWTNSYTPFWVPLAWVALFLGGWLLSLAILLLVLIALELRR
jgi:hypothetical protein